MSLDSLYGSKNANRTGSGRSSGEEKPDLLCFSHLRWDWVFQRPQHLMTRFARDRRVFYFEEPVFDGRQEAKLEIRPVEGGVAVATPHLPAGLAEEAIFRTCRELLDHLMAGWKVEDFVTWHYSPLFLPFSSHLRPRLMVYDCMDELSAFAGCHPAMISREAELLSRVDLVLTGGMSLYGAKRNRHPDVHAFPSSIDQEHFRKSRMPGAEPPDQGSIGRPRIGFHGVIDERFDHGLIARAADLRPDWNWILIGPVTKIDPGILPRKPNIHYLGKKDYAELPDYLSGWDIAMMPFARNEATRYISPTKTPEYLAAGKPVVSTSIRDVIDPYGEKGLVEIADSPEDFVKACGAAFDRIGDREWQAKVEDFLSRMSWDKTWARMDDLIQAGLQAGLQARGEAKSGAAAGAVSAHGVSGNGRAKHV